MQTLDTILQVTSRGNAWTDEYGNIQPMPRLTAGIRAVLRIQLRGQYAANGETSEELDGQLPPYDAAAMADGCASYFVALDGDYDHSTAPRLVRQTGISLAVGEDGYGVFTVELPATAYAGIFAALASSGAIVLLGELGGLDADGEKVFSLPFNIQLDNPVWIPSEGGGDTPDPEDPAYLTAAQTRAFVFGLVAAGFAIQYSSDGETWHDTQASGDQYMRIRSASDAAAAWSSAIAIPSGAPGKDGEDGASAYDIWLANGHEGTEADFLEWLKGADGSGVNSATATTLSPGSAATVSLVDGALHIGVPRGNAGVSTYTYVAYAEDSAGTGFSLEPSNTRKYRAEIHTAQKIATPTASDFAGATWVKFIGDPGDGAFTVDDTLSNTSENAVQNKVIKAKLDTQDASIAALQAEVRTKQPTLSYDTAPTPNSNNPVTSGGIYAAIQAITPGGGGDSIADENVVSPIDSIATIKDYYDNAQHGFAAGINKVMVAANANTDSDTELKQGHAYAVITLPEAITTETITIWQWTISWTATTRLHLMTTAEAEEQEHEDIYGRFGGDYYRDETGGGWLRDDRAWRIISGTLAGESTPRYVIVPGNLKWDTMSFGDIYSGIQAIETDPGHIDGKLCGTTQPGTVLTDYEPYIGGRVVRRVYTLQGLTILIHDITPCVCGSCPLEARIAALENA